MTIDSTAGSSIATAEGWFCIRCHPKREHIAAAHLRKIENVEVFSPRLKIRKATKRGRVLFVESVFPNYVFARFDLHALLNKVKYSPSVSTVVHFGNRIPQIPNEIIAELREHFGEDEVVEVETHVQPGDEVVIGDGPFYGMKAKVLRIMTPNERVEVLLEMLGRVTPVIVDPNFLVPEDSF